MNMRSYLSIALGTVFLLIATLTLGIFTQHKKEATQPAPASRPLTPATKAPLMPGQMTQKPAAAPAGELDKDQVCMVNNAYMGKK